jgi:hypothetical protein
MRLTKNELKKLILESFQEQVGQQFDGNKRISPIGQNPPKGVDPKQVMKQNISQQIRVLKFMQETLKQIKIPIELKNMVDQIKKSKTSDFLKQVLGVDETIPIKVSSVLENPLELLQAIMGQIVKVAIEKGNKKLTEGKIEEKDLKYYIREPEARLQKHKQKIDKGKTPPPKLEEDAVFSTQKISEILDDDSAEYEILDMSIAKIEAAVTYLEGVMEDLPQTNDRKIVNDILNRLKNDISALETIKNGNE